MLLGDTVVYIILAMYLEQVLPSKHRVRRPWYLFECFRNWRQVGPAEKAKKARVYFQVSESEGDGDDDEEEGKQRENGETLEMRERKKSTATVTSVIKNFEPIQGSSFESEPRHAEVGVDVRDISKWFGSRKKMAVNGVSLKMFTGDIFVLIGQSGTGKTTLISVLTGFFAPSSGTAIINGYDIRKNMGKARKTMGLCPQHDMLFEKLTVSEQLCLFGRLRGLSRQKAKEEADMLLTRMEMLDKSSISAKKLSGGQKRKLSLALALIGGTSVVILDEPTSGLDPQARREIWDLLQEMHGKRTILLTTQFMEEADVLGDRIGIMADGRLQCCGSAAFLKKYYGAGYSLKLTLLENIEATPSELIIPLVRTASASVNASRTALAALETVRKQIPDARFNSISYIDGERSEVILTLPKETATTSALGEMFADLMAGKKKLRIDTMGLSQTTMDELLIKVGELAEEQKYVKVVEAWDMDEEGFQRAPKQASGECCGQFTALLKKKYIYTVRNSSFILIEVVLTLALFIILIFAYNIAISEIVRQRDAPTNQTGAADRSLLTSRAGSEAGISSTDALRISLDTYKKPITLFYSQKGALRNILVDVIGSSATPVKSDVSSTLLTAGKKYRISYKRQHVIAADVDSLSFKVMFNLYPYHAAPLAINIASNTLLKELSPGGNYRLRVTNHPLRDITTDKSRQQQRSGGSDDGTDSRIFQVISVAVPSVVSNLVSLGLIFFVSNFVRSPVEENLSKTKQLQLMTGVSPLVYWGTSFLWDYTLYFVYSISMLVVLFLFDYQLGYGLLTTNWGWLVFLLILLVYGLPAIIFSYVMSFRPSSVAGGFALVTLLHIVTGLCLGFLPDPGVDSNLSTTTYRLVVTFRVIGRFFPTYSVVRALWYYGRVVAINNLCEIVVPKATRASNSCPKQEAYLVWMRLDTPTKANIPAAGQEIFFMLLDSLLYFGILMMIEFKVFRKIGSIICPDNRKVFLPNVNDEDVLHEMEHVDKLISNGETEKECLVVEDLSKSFGSFAAVSQLYFGVHYGECFGLLGVQGSGKTTAFRMITGDEMPSLGVVYGFGTSLKSERKRFLSQIGYCPQFDGLLHKFTGKEMLKLFAGLRGVPRKSRENEAILWLTRMGLQEYANLRCGKYSGGMKRRLSTAMAMIGDPMLILLDEPTNGVDPVSRRMFWKILKKMKESGQSIILTSHSMEECEVLCNRVGIMVNGQIQRIGGVQHLKNKFAQGYSLTIKLISDHSLAPEVFEEKIQKLSQNIFEKFQPCVLKDKHQSLLQFSLQNPSITWDVLFKLMEEVKQEFSDLLEDYSVSEISLEEVFLSFAKTQHPERKATKSLCKKVLTCSC